MMAANTFPKPSTQPRTPVVDPESAPPSDNIWEKFNAERASGYTYGRLRPVTFRVTDTGCWICTSHKAGAQGYPRTNLDGSTITLPWLARQLCGGEKTLGRFTRHTCDVRMCINPSHLLGGTHQDNVDDATSRNRHCFGMRNGQAKLSNEDALAIFRSPDRYTELSERFGISQAVISNIKHGKLWAHVTGVRS